MAAAVHPLASRAAIAAYGLTGTGYFAWKYRSAVQASQGLYKKVLEEEGRTTRLTRDLKITQDQLTVAMTCQPAREEMEALRARLDTSSKEGEGRFSDGALVGMFSSLVGVGVGALTMGIGQMC